MTVEKINTKSGIMLLAEKNIRDRALEVSLEMEGRKECLLHWGIRRDINAPWEMPPESVWPDGSRAFDHKAVQTPFFGKNGLNAITFRLGPQSTYSFIDFALFFPQEGRWDNNRGKNYRIVISGPDNPSLSLIQILRQEVDQKSIFYEHVHHIEAEGQLAVMVTRYGGIFHIVLVTDIQGPLILHWGVARRSLYEWVLPPRSICPPNTTIFQNNSAQTPFTDQAGHRWLKLSINEKDAPMGISFVLRRQEKDNWLKDHGRNFYIPLASPKAHEGSLDTGLAGLAQEIIEKEMGHNSWTLMHRFDLCYELLDRARHDMESFGLIFVWLRFSAVRQLDWQRNYNTKPRELSHALDRLTIKLADLYLSEKEVRPFIRLIMRTLGRGGEGQRVRDEILKIMHRHRIKEVSGHFMEEWHQKLHNNTTPDDVVICEAYLNFLRGDGDLDLFYKVLNKGGVTKKRMEGFERPIKSPPDFVPHLRDELIHDFEHFLGVLKSVHSGTDLGSAIYAARYMFDEEMHSMMDYLWSHRDDRDVPVCVLVEKITVARRRLAKWPRENENQVRDLLFLDLALEDFMRVVVEGSLHLELNSDKLVDLTGMALANLCLSDDGEEFRQCLQHWQRVKDGPRLKREWSIQAEAVLDRLGRALSAFTDQYHQLLQPKAEFLGRAFNAESWSISLFSEEVIRGGPVFLLSVLVSRLNPVLRKNVGLGDWQVVSRGQGVGEVKVVASLKDIQGESFTHPAVIVADKVVGDEEIPKGVTAIITSDMTDIVSHVAIRARNGRVLFATCYNTEKIEQMKSLRGHNISLEVDTTGDVIVQEASEREDIAYSRPHPVHVSSSPPDFTAYVMPARDFDERHVGGKSLNLTSVFGKLPEWVSFPSSVAVPFGVFEKVLAEDRNKDIAGRHKEMAHRIENEEGKINGGLLRELRKDILGLRVPDGLRTSLYKVMEEAGLPLPANWEEAWRCIKRVWASKWNERAYLSRLANGVPHDSLFMAVLVQDVVAADYSFVIHTVNPFTGERDEIYAEVVLGLGETLVGNYPGRALGFTCKKGGHEPRLRAFPSKSVGLYGSGLIFRSDSNGEDLADYAGAGLYDSIMLEPAREVNLDYSRDRLICDEAFRRDLLATISTIGTMVEDALGGAQDIEGAYTNGQYYIVQTRPQVGI